MIGTSLAHYRVLEKVGEGGMGVVYRALDTHLDRTVALKLLRPEAVGDAERRWRFLREAKAASALNHPNIVTIHDVAADQSVDFIVMEFVEGTSLDRLIPKGGLPVDEVIRTGGQIASALGAAHAAGIVHRDVKPANVVVGPGGRVKVLDFGLAKLMEPASGSLLETSDSTATAASVVERTRQGVILGTVAYMSPEQAEGKPVDARSDVFSLGAVLYEMLAGRRPFEGDSYLKTLTAILRDPPAPLGTVRPGVPAALARIVARALEKRPEDRYASATAMERELAALAEPATASRSLVRRPAFLLAAAFVVLAAGGAAWKLGHDARLRRAREALFEIPRLVEQQKILEAFRLAREAERVIPEEVARLRRETWALFPIRSEPPGAEVFMKPYVDVRAEWVPLGKTPIEEARLPVAYYRFKFNREGYRTVEGAAALDPIEIRLDPEAAAPPGMVRVPGGSFALGSLDAVQLEDFWLDTYEVTNREYKAFVDAGGYSRREFWKPPFFRAGFEVPFDEALAAFRDATGRPGPATWELGTFPEGRENHPVEGVSWYEAAAYAEWAGKSLPTIYHWYRAAGQELFSEILSLSNFTGKGAAPRGTFQGLGPWGNFDMAGNVKEWCWNGNGTRRYILGGSSTEVSYMYQEADAQDPFLRMAGYGFRCARYAAPLAAALLAPVGALNRDYLKEKPVSDEVFRAYRGLYAYDKGPLDVRSEGVDDSSPWWRREKVSILSAYGNERVPIFLFLPKSARPPWQTVVFFPHSGARIMRSTAEMDLTVIDFVVRSGRALCYPVYRDTYERHVERTASGPNFRRDLVVQWSKDLGRAIDWLETRKDLDTSRLVFYGVSLGAIDGVPLVAVEPRVKAAVFLAGGFRLRRAAPEIDLLNFAPRVTVPVLLIGGRYDFQHPLETAQRPLFEALGTPAAEKKHVVFEGGHVAPRLQPIIKEILDWLDRTQGPVLGAS